MLRAGVHTYRKVGEAVVPSAVLVVASAIVAFADVLGKNSAEKYKNQVPKRANEIKSLTGRNMVQYGTTCYNMAQYGTI